MLIHSANAATPQQQHERNLAYTYRYESSSALSNPVTDQQYLSDNLLCDTTSRIQRNQQQQTSTLINKLQTQLNEIDPRFEHREILDKMKPSYYIEDIYKAVARNYEYKLATKTNHLPQAANQQLYHPIVGKATYSPFSKHFTEIVYAPPLTQFERMNGVEQQTPPLNALPYLQHKSHSNQQQYAPERRTVANTRPAHEKLLPYPPSFISITSTSTTATPPQNAPRNSLDYDVKGISKFPDIFVKRQDKSLLDSYIPSWVMTRIIQQNKWLQRKQLPRFMIPTHTLAYPIEKRVA
ncbi:uncharacterized protein LOC118748224 [Rhagoletis pomonella]|uniref:uncharacterized protein LOC118748224 n=1 Tax=Rhagoletis pomonella TaxID=28610 RepID=UPI00178339AF|nr:uncharacterized protein LOC118748224 [Rhagoletis pomonella]